MKRVYFKAAAVCVILMPFMTLGIWLGSRLTGFPWTFRQACGGGTSLAVTMFLWLLVSTGGRYTVKRERERLEQENFIRERHDWPQDPA